MSGIDLKNDLICYAHSLGFERVGVTSAESLQKEELYLTRWVAEGRAGDMDYMARAPERRARPSELLAGARSVIALAMPYSVEDGETKRQSDGGNKKIALSLRHSVTPSSEGRVSRYARGADYHKVIRKRLESFVRYLGAIEPGAECRTFVDTGPLLERALAQRAGLGFIGKNTMLITKELGSWVFLANVITTLDLAPDAPDDRSCGECRLCIDACPTQAITEPFHLDARLCIAYQTIESDAAVSNDEKEKRGGWIFGCDICQEVCPHNARRTPPPVELGLAPILSIRTQEEFEKRFAGTAFMRAGREGLIRNACVAAANLGRRDLRPELEHLSRQDPHDAVREEAAWALEQLR